MKVSFPWGLAAGVALLAVMAFQSPALAQTCQSECALQGKACVLTARTTKSACRLDCRTNAAQGAVAQCIRGCVQAFRADRAGCQSDVPGCVGACEAPDDPSAPAGSVPCAGTCGQALGTCAQGVVSQARDCVKECRSASDRLECLQACAATAQSEAEDCASGFGSCREGCGSPSGAFVD